MVRSNAGSTSSSSVSVVVVLLVLAVPSAFLVGMNVGVSRSASVLGEPAVSGDAPRVSAPNAAPSRSDDDFALAFHESYGFFTDIPSEDWKRKKEIAAHTPHHLEARWDKLADFFYEPRGWYQNNWEPDFSCSFERFVGPIRDGHKWVCDPHRLADKKDCLVYSFGSNGNTDFEGGIREIAPHCEIHVFDPGTFGAKVQRNLPGATYHRFGLKPSYETDPALLEQEKKFELPRGTFATFAEVVKSLGHEGRTVDVFKIDIEGGEWTTFRDWLNGGVELRQILVEVHTSPPIANDFFEALHEAGYAMFHKEPNIQFAGGDCLEFAFLKLRPSFFQAEPAQPGLRHQPTKHSRQAFQHAEQHREEYKQNQKKKFYDYRREMKQTGIV